MTTTADPTAGPTPAHRDSPELTPLPELLMEVAASTAPRQTTGGAEDQGGTGAGADSDEDADMDEISGAGDEYELERAENIRNNAALLASLGLNSAETIRPHPSSASRAAALKAERKPVVSSEEQRVRRETRARVAALKREVAPTRRSGRVAAQAIKAEAGDVDDVKLEALDDRSSRALPQVKYEPIPKQAAPILASGPEYDDDGADGQILFADQPRPSRKADGTLIFEGRWKGVFTPNVTPEEMFTGGAFGGAFFCDTFSHSLKTSLSAQTDIAALPFTLSPALARTRLSAREPDGAANRFGVRAGQSLQEWEKAGWIWSGDPRGWAQWYVRFWNGRRCVDDERQVKRWLKVAGPTGRFKRALLKKVHMSGGKAVLADEDVGRVVRQTLWQWGYELTESEYDAAMSSS